MAVNKVFIAGSGLMGSGIAQVSAQSGIRVYLYDINPIALEKSLKNIEWSVGKLAEKGLLKEEKATVTGRIKTAGDYSCLPEADLIIEAVFENRDLKQKIFREIDGIASADAILASNTSAIPVTELASVTRRPEKVLGLHFFSPVPMMQAVEVIRGLATDDETVRRGKEFVLRIGKEPIMVNRDTAGFVINRINFPSAIEAMRVVEEGVATPEDIDKGLRLASGRKMGIFETGDMVGLDVTYGAMMAIYLETGDPRWYPPLLLRRKVKAGHLGKKTGRGWYEYNDDGSRKENRKP
jgi:3-hydroxybutyryl-CoA dehydrogenase